MSNSLLVNESPLQNIGFSNPCITLQKKNFTGSPLNSGIFPNSFTEIEQNPKNLNIFRKKTFKREQTTQKGSQNIDLIDFTFKCFLFEAGEWKMMGIVKKFSKKMLGLLQSRNLSKMNKFHFTVLREDFDTSHEVFLNFH